MLKRILLIVLILVSLPNIMSASKLKDNATIALLDFEVKSMSVETNEELEPLVKMAPVYVREAIKIDGRISLLDKEFVNEKLNAINFKVPKIFSKDDLKIIRNTLGCRYLILGTVYSVATENALWYHQKALKCPQNIINVRTHMVLRVLDITENKIVYAAFGKGNYPNRYGGNLIKVGNYDVSKETVSKSIKRASDDAVRKLLRGLYSKK